MRTGDLAVPPVTPHAIPPGAPLAAWPATLTIAIQRTPGTVAVWDEGRVWDDPTDPGAVWDATATPPVWVDAVCDFAGLTIDTGQPDELGLFPAISATVTLDNSTGRWSTWTTTGRLAAYPIGTPIAVWATVAGTTRWLFSGRVTAWTEVGQTVTVEAFDLYADLATELGDEWVPGGDGQRPLARIGSIAATAGWPGTLTGDAGDNVLTAGVLERNVSPLEAAQIAALSDGGIVAGDADGRVFYRDRRWRNGRADQAVIRAFTDNRCDAGAVVVWDAETGASDFGAATEVRLTNEAGTVVVAGGTATRPVRLTHPQPDQWTTTADGQTLAAYLLANAVPTFRVHSFDLYVTDARHPNLFDVATDLRRGDRFVWTTDTRDPTGAPLALQLDVIVAGTRHDITPEQWVATVYGTRAVSARTVILWDDGRLWDDLAAHPDNVWST